MLKRYVPEHKVRVFKNGKLLARLNNLLIESNTNYENILEIHGSLLPIREPIYTYTGTIYIKHMSSNGKRYFNYCFNNKTKFSFNIIMIDSNKKKTISKIQGRDLEKLEYEYGYTFNINKCIIGSN